MLAASPYNGSMASDIPVRCACGKLEGIARDLSPNAGAHVVCYCDDCQCFQHYLGQAEHVLDEHGGTDIFQMSPGKLEITSGREHLACLRLRPDGTVRWYAACCNTPIGNTLATPALPFVGVITVFIDPQGDAATRAAALGPVTGGVFARYALGDTASLDAHAKAPLSMIFSFLGRVARWRLGGAHKQTPFFDRSTGALATTPTILTEEELADVRQKQKDYRPAA